MIPPTALLRNETKSRKYFSKGLQFYLLIAWFYIFTNRGTQREHFKSKGGNGFLSLGSSDHIEYHIPDYEKKAHKLEYAKGTENGEER